MKKSDFYYELPPELIAQTPLANRDHSRLMTLNRSTGAVGGAHFYDLPALLQPGDCLILNDTKVLPARIYGQRETDGAIVEFLLLHQKSADTWESLAGPGKKAKRGDRFSFPDDILQCVVLDVLENGNRVLQFTFEGNFFAVLDRIGQMPLPHYITEELQEKERYQTIYAKEPGSAAAPTAGLHFTEETLQALRSQNIQIGYLTLHVGLGTFRPVKAENIEDHLMHAEHYELPEATAALIRDTKAKGGRVFAVGTTCCRTLESIAQEDGSIRAQEGWTDIFIYPGYTFRCIDGLITNFHLPESTLIMLVCAFAGYELAMRAYTQAVQEQYRFFSFGDAMIIT